MENKINLFLDEDVHPTLASVLREMGYNTISTIEANRKGKSDREQLDFSIAEKRAILTFNVKDFVLLYDEYYKKDKKHWGIIVSSQLNFKETLKRILKLLNRKSASDLENNIEFLNNWKE